MQKRKKTRGFIKLIIFFLCLSPFMLLCIDTLQDNLGANPIETLHFTLGDWALRFLCLTLFITPFKQITGLSQVMRFRRMLGLFAFFYATLHLLVYIVLDISFSWQQFKQEINETPYILFGLITFLILMPLAFTSTRKMQKYLGKRWKRLHQLVYLAAIMAVLHYILLVKADLTQPLIYTVLILSLLTWRLNRYSGVHKRSLFVKTLR